MKQISFTEIENQFNEMIKTPNRTKKKVISFEELVNSFTDLGISLDKKSPRTRKDSKKECEWVDVNVEEEPVIIDTTVIVEEDDGYSEVILKEYYRTHFEHVTNLKNLQVKYPKITARFPGIPEHISENIIKFVIRNKLKKNSSWRCKGDLISLNEGVQECKCFTSDGPISFSPSSDFDIIYFMDARKIKDDYFVIFRCNMKRSGNSWQNIMMTEEETFSDQCDQGRRPRITWERLYPQIMNDCEIIYQGNFENIFRMD